MPASSHYVPMSLPWCLLALSQRRKMPPTQRQGLLKRFVPIKRQFNVLLLCLFRGNVSLLVMEWSRTVNRECEVDPLYMQSVIKKEPPFFDGVKWVKAELTRMSKVKEPLLACCMLLPVTAQDIEMVGQIWRCVFTTARYKVCSSFVS